MCGAAGNVAGTPARKCAKLVGFFAFCTSTSRGPPPPCTPQAAHELSESLSAQALRPQHQAREAARLA